MNSCLPWQGTDGRLKQQFCSVLSWWTTELTGMIGITYLGMGTWEVLASPKSPCQKGHWITKAASLIVLPWLGCKQPHPSLTVFLAEGPLEPSIFLSFLSLRNLCFFPPGGRISDIGRCKCSAHFSQRKTCPPMWKHMPFSKSMKPQSEADVSGECHRFQHKLWANWSLAEWSTDSS